MKSRTFWNSSGGHGWGPSPLGRGAQVFRKRATNLPQDLTRQRRVTVLEGNAGRVGSPSSVNGTDEPICRAETETQEKNMDTKRGRRGGMSGEIGIDRNTLLILV